MAGKKGTKRFILKGSLLVVGSSTAFQKRKLSGFVLDGIILV